MSYDAIFDATREPMREIEREWTRPCVVFRPKIYLDGDKWCALLGDNIQEGVVGFGETPAKAMFEFDKAWWGQK